jgi:hypothetical protein
VTAHSQTALLLFRSKSAEFSDNCPSTESSSTSSSSLAGSYSNEHYAEPSISIPSSPVNANSLDPVSPNANGKRPQGDEFFLESSEPVSATFVLGFIYLFSTQVLDYIGHPKAQEAKDPSDAAGLQVVSSEIPVVGNPGPFVNSLDTLVNHVDAITEGERPSKELDGGHVLDFRLSQKVTSICERLYPG